MTSSGVKTLRRVKGLVKVVIQLFTGINDAINK